MRKKSLPTVAEFLRLRWQPLSERPLIEPPHFSPIIADPTFLPPEASPDGLWHLFAHSVFGIHHYTGESASNWQRQGVVKRHAMRAFVFAHGAEFHLYYERYRALQIFFSWLTRWRWKSRLEVMSSSDLRRWSAPKVILLPHLAWHKDSPYGESVSNPCVVAVKNGFRLYYSASLRLVPDCGFCEPAHIGMATAAEPTGPFVTEAVPQLSPEPAREWMNLGAGAIKVICLADGYVGLQNGIYTDNRGNSGSAIYAVPSRDGRKWHWQKAKCVLAPDPAYTWRASHVYALDCRYAAREQRWYLFFNGRTTAHWSRGREAIGALYA